MSTLMVWAWLALAAVPSPQAPSLSGTVVDPEGKPVKGATVWLTRLVKYDVDAEELGQVEADAEGRFAFDTPAAIVGDRQRFVTLWAHAPGKRVYIISPIARPKDEQGPIPLTLGPPAKTPVRVRGVDGKPVAGATVRTTPFVWPAGLRARLEATTDAQGLAAIEDVNPGQIWRVDVTTNELGTRGYNVSQEDAEKAVQLLPNARVEAKIVSADPKALAGWTVVASSHPAEAGNSPYATNEVRGRSDEAGRVALGLLAAGRITFRIEPPEGSPFLPLPSTPAQTTLRGGENYAVEIPVKKAVKVEGSVVEHGGKPAAGVKVNLYVLSPYQRNDNVVTDAEGRFSGYFLPCKLRISLTWFDLPDRYYQAPDNTHWADHDLASNELAKTLAPLEVWPAASIKGTVVDEVGKPAAGVFVNGSCLSREFGDRPIPGSTQADERGVFVLGHMAPDSTVQVRAQVSTRAEAEPVTVRLDGKGTQDRPVTLKLVKRPTVALRGRVLGPGGQPVAGVRVTISVQSANSSNVYGHGKEEGILTGPDGRFQTPNAVPRSEQYRAHITAPGMNPGESDWSDAPKGELPDVILRRTTRLRSVAGRVVDAEGRAVAGAEVFQSGDGPKRTNDTTDADGRFKIPGVLDAPAFLFVKKAGYHFAGRRIGTGDGPVTVVVSKLDGPAPPPLKPVPPRSARAGERAKARELVASAWKGFNPGEYQGPDSPASTLALVDTDRVVEMIEDQVLKPSGPLLANIALGLFEGDPHAAVATLDAIRPATMAAEAMLDLADRVPDAPADVRDDLLTRALGLARGVPEPAKRAALTARVADRRFAAGETAKARPVLAEARAALTGKANPAGGDDANRKMAEGAQVEIQVVGSDSSPAERVDLANALARVDLPAALALLEPGKNEENLATLARRAASNDPAGAERVFAGLTQRNVKLGVMADLAAGMAEKDLAKAVALPTRAGAPGVAAHTLAAAARYKASTDPSAARKLLAEAYDRLEPLTGMIVIPTVSMARLLPTAIRVDPDRSSDYLWRAIAARPPRASGQNFGTTRSDMLILAQLAALVSRYDVEAAETIFAPVAESSKALFDDRFGGSNELGAIFGAAATFDPQAALAMFAAIPEDPEPGPRNRQGGPPAFAPRTKEKARLAVARALALPPAARLREALRVPGQVNLWPAVLDD